MRLDSLARLIEAADFGSFRELALACLALKGYREVTLTDGWADGGTDVRVFQLPPNPTPIAFQVTVEWEWKAKLHDDARKVKSRLKLDHMTIITSRRLAEAEFQAESERVWREVGVQATKIDSQSIASTFFRENQTTRVLKIFGIEVPDKTPTRQTNPRTDAAYSFVFFGKETNRFRDATIESAIISALARAERSPRDAITTEVAGILGFQDAQELRISSVIDRMIQNGAIHGPASALVLGPALADAARAMDALREAQRNRLRDEVTTLLRKYSGTTKTPGPMLDAVMEDLGAVLLETAQAAAATPERPRVVADGVRARLRHFHSTLDTFGIKDGAPRDRAVAELADLAANSPLGTQLLAGELFLSISAVKMPGLIAALGARSGAEVVLDASVAIPMLCGLLFHPTSTAFSLGAQHAYRQAISQGVSLVLPDVYLEETAAHLIDAWRYYEVVADVDADLTKSENAFVAHYAGLRAEGWIGTFDQYLRAFGLDPAVRQMQFFQALEVLMPKPQRLFDRYGIVVRYVGHSQTAKRRAEEAVAHAIHELDIARPEVVIRHDARVLGYLFTQDAFAEIARVLCTWDSLHFWVREHEDASWDALNPALLGDLLSLAAPEDSGGPIASPLVIARLMSEEAAAAGATVWDKLVKLEAGKLHDSELLEEAKRFKEAFVGQIQKGETIANLGQAWTTWKAAHYRKS